VVGIEPPMPLSQVKDQQLGQLRRYQSQLASWPRRPAPAPTVA